MNWRQRSCFFRSWYSDLRDIYWKQHFQTILVSTIKCVKVTVSWCSLKPYLGWVFSWLLVDGGGTGGCKKGRPCLNSVTHMLQLWNFTDLCLAWRRSKKYSSAEISIFSPEISRFCYIEKYSCRLHFDTKLPIIFGFFEYSKILLINMVTILMLSAKMATQDLLKIKVFLIKSYDVIIYANDVTNKCLSRD